MDTMYTVNPDGSRNFVHPADVKGRWQLRKNVAWTVLIGVYLAMPWIPIGGRPAVHIDLPGRNAFLFGQTFTNQDFYLVFFILSGIGFALFVATSLWGRVWCGFACPQTVFLEGVFRRIERRLEGPRQVRIRRNLGPLTADKVWRKGLKHVLFLGISLGLAHAFTAYFIPAPELRRAVLEDPSRHWAAFLWTVAWTGMLYFDYSWFREQTCLIICPYGRLQSALVDADTVVVGYDPNRGEPRSKLNDEGGDCIDCHRCVQVCPTGIDIRNGLQMECVGCANCIDACDDIMDRVKRPRGLIRYDSQRGFETGVRRSLKRPRVFVYALLGLVGISVFAVAASGRDPFEVKVLRARGLPFTLQEGSVQNLYNLRIQNKTQVDRTYLITVTADGQPGVAFILPEPLVRVTALGDEQVPVFARIPREQFTGRFSVAFTARDSTGGAVRSAEATFLGPGR
jgi:cytochrome c oxidase accessory protein FixG